MTRKRNHFQDKYSINLHYIRAAIEANTGQRLTLERVRELLVEEGLITKSQAERNAQLFTGYSDFTTIPQSQGNLRITARSKKSCVASKTTGEK